MGYRKIVFALCWLLSAPAAHAVTSTWIGAASGNWTDAANWDSVDYPDNTFFVDYDVVLDGNLGQNTTVTLAGNAAIDSLTITAGDLLRVNNGQLLEILTALTGPGTIDTAGSAAVNVYSGTVDGIVKQGSGELDIRNSTVRNISHEAGVLVLSSPRLDGAISNHALVRLDGVGSFTDASFSGNGEIAATDALLLADTIGSRLTFSGNQRITGTTASPTPLTIANFGIMQIDGVLEVDAPRMEINNNMTLTSATTGTIRTGAGAIVVVNNSTIDNILHESTAGSGAMFIINGTVRDLTTASGLLSIDGVALEGTITNNALTQISGNGSFDGATLGGSGELRLGNAVLTAVTPGSTFTFTGNQRLTGATTDPLAFNGLGTILIDGGIQVDGGRLEINNGSTLTTLTTLTTGVIDTVNGGVVVLNDSTIDNLEYNPGDVSGGLFAYSSTVRDVTVSNGRLSIVDSDLDGTISNNAETALGGLGGFSDVTINGNGDLIAVGATLSADAIDDTLTFGGSQRLTGSTSSGLTINNFARVLIDGGLQVDGGRLEINNSSTLSTLTTGQIDTVNGGVVVLNDSTIDSLEYNPGDSSGGLFAYTSTVRDITVSNGRLSIVDSDLDGTIINNAETALGGLGGFSDVTINGNGDLIAVGATLSADSIDDTLTFGGSQRLTGSTSSGLTINNFARVLIDGGLQVDGGRLEVRNGSTLTSLTTGAIETLNGGVVVVDQSTVSNIVHSAPTSGSGLFVSDGEIRDVTTNGGILSIIDSEIGGTITNNSLTGLGGTNTFTRATIAGNGELGVSGVLMANNIGDTLTFSGNQRMTGSLSSPLTVTNFGVVEVLGGIEADGARFEVIGGSTLTGRSAGTLTTSNGGIIYVDRNSVVENITHDSSDSSGALAVYDSIARNVHNQSRGTLLLFNARLEQDIVNSGRIITSSPLTVGTGARLRQDNGLIQGDVLVNGGGILSGGGIIEGDVTIATDGIIGNDAMAAQMDVFGLLDMDGLMQMEIGGAVPGQYDQYNVYDSIFTPGSGGSAFLGGVLELMLLPSYSPLAGDSFDLVTATKVDTTGLSLSFLSLSPTLDYFSTVVVEASREILRVSLFEVQLDPVPVPPAIWLFGSGLLALFGFSKRKNRTG